MIFRALQSLCAFFVPKLACLAGLVGAFYLVRFVLRVWRDLGRHDGVF